MIILNRYGRNSLKYRFLRFISKRFNVIIITGVQKKK